MRLKVVLLALAVSLCSGEGHSPAALPTPRKPGSLSSSSVAVSSDGTLVAAVNSDSGSVTLVDARSLRVVREIAVGADPRTLCFSADSRRLAVANHGSSDVTLLQFPSFKTRRVRLLGMPYGVVISGRTAFVSEFSAASVAAIDLDAGRVVARIKTTTFPAGLALTPDAKSLLVTHFYSGMLTRIDLGTLEVRDELEAGGKNANLSQFVAVSTDGRKAFLPQTLSNAGARTLSFDALLVPVVNVVDLTSMTVVGRERLYLASLQRGASRPAAAVLSADGNSLLVANAGSDDVAVSDISSGMLIAHIDVGEGPSGLASSPDGTRIFVNNALGGRLSVIRGKRLREADGHSSFFVHKAVAFDVRRPVSCRACHADSLDSSPLDSNVMMELAVGKLRLANQAWLREKDIALTKIPLSKTILAGKKLFHSAAKDELTLHRWISCASCHPDGGADGRTWRGFPDGPRNTPALFGSSRTLPSHWSGDFDELHDSELTIRSVQFGRGLVREKERLSRGAPYAGASEELDALAAYIASLQAPVSPFASEKAAIERGAAVFDKLGCGSCHVPPLYTDRKMHAVGTAATQRFDTPSLRALWLTAPYFHDGSARTLEEALRRGREHDAAGRLSEEEARDLVSFLNAL